MPCKRSSSVTRIESLLTQERYYGGAGILQKKFLSNEDWKFFSLFCRTTPFDPLQKKFLSNEDWKSKTQKAIPRRRENLQKKFLSNEDWKWRTTFYGL